MIFYISLAIRGVCINTVLQWHVNQYPRSDAFVRKRWGQVKYMIDHDYILVICANFEICCLLNVMTNIRAQNKKPEYIYSVHKLPISISYINGYGEGGGGT